MGRIGRRTRRIEVLPTRAPEAPARETPPAQPAHPAPEREAPAPAPAQPVPA